MSCTPYSVDEELRGCKGESALGQRCNLGFAEGDGGNGEKGRRDRARAIPGSVFLRL